MSNLRIVTKNFVSLLVVRMFVPLASFVIFTAVARLMGAESLGKYSLLITMFTIFQFLASMGMGPLLTRQIAQKRDSVERLYSSALLTGVLSPVFWAPLMVAVSWLCGYPNDVLVSSMYLALALPFAYLCIINEAAFMGIERFEFIPLVNLVESLFTLGVSMVVITQGLTLMSLAAVLACAKLVSALVGTPLLARQVRLFPAAFDRRLALEMVKLAPAFLVLYGSVILFFQMDILQLSFLVSERDLGLYASANKLYLVALVLPSAFGQAFYPRVSAKAAEGDVAEICLRALRYALLALTPVVLCFFVLADMLITLVFGMEYLPSAPVLMVAIWNLFPFLAGSILGHTLLAGSHQAGSARVTVLALLCEVVLLSLFTVSLGYQGAALAVLISQCVLLFLLTYHLERTMFRVRIFADVLHYCIPAAGGAVVSYLMPWAGDSFRLAVALLTALVLALVLRMVRKDDLVWILRFFRPVTRAV